MQPNKLAAINGLITFSFWSVMASLLANNLSGFFTVISLVFIPVSVLVSWRSKLLAPQLIEGVATLKLYAVDGFKWGVFGGIAFWTWSISNQVFAAGDPLRGAGLSQVIKFIFTISLPTTFLFGLVGLIHSVMFYYLNRWLVVNYS